MVKFRIVILNYTLVINCRKVYRTPFYLVGTPLSVLYLYHYVLRYVKIIYLPMSVTKIGKPNKIIVTSAVYENSMFHV